jgi:hypothetical protein
MWPVGAAENILREKLPIDLDAHAIGRGREFYLRSESAAYDEAEREDEEAERWAGHGDRRS